MKPSVALEKGPGWGTFVVNSWIFIPAIFFFYIVFLHARNIPIMDDYDAILNFLSSYEKAGFKDKMILLLSQHNEHRLLYSRILYVLYYTIFGNVNFRNIIIIGDFQLLGIVLVSVYFIRRCAGKYWSILALIWTLCIFDLNSYENGDIAMYGIQNYGVIMLFFVSLFFYSRDNKLSIAAGAVVQAICIFSSGNGMIASLFLVISAIPGKNRLKKIVSIATMLVFTPLYFVGYKVVDPADNRYHTTFDIASLYFTKMTGAYFNFDNSLIFGAIILVVLLVTFPYKKLFANPAIWPILCILGFSIASMTSITLFRSNMPNAQFQASRYLIYPELIVATACLFIFLKLEGKKVKLFVAIVLLLVILKTYSNNYLFGEAGFERTEARAENIPYWYPDMKRAKEIAVAACQAGIYCLDDER